MKKTGFLYLSLALAAVVTAGCSKNSKSGDSATDGASDTALAVDSVGFKSSEEWLYRDMSENTRFSVDYSAQYPVSGPELLVDSVRAFIADAAGLPAGTDLSDGSRLMETAGKQALSVAKEEGGFGPAGGESILSVKLEYQTPRYVTFSVLTYEYTGGANGMGISRGVTFDAATGATLGWNIFSSEGKEKLSKLVETALCKQYFEVPDWKTYRESWDQDFALPTLPPAFTKDGVTFYYTPYEIGPYAAGAPECTLPYAEMAPLMTPEAAALVK